MGFAVFCGAFRKDGKPQKISKLDHGDDEEKEMGKHSQIVPALFFKCFFDVFCKDNSAQVRPSIREKRIQEEECKKPPLPPPHFVKESHYVTEDEDFDGHKTINDYVRQLKIGTGSYCKVVLFQNMKDDKFYAMKVFRKSRLRKIRINQLETALTDVLREVSISKQLNHPNVVKLFEVIDDPTSDKLYMVLEYMDRGCIFKGAGPPGGIGESLAQAYFRDIVAGLKYLHENNIMHGDIKPENLLLGSDGHVKICDFSASRQFKNNNDELHRSAGTPIFTAPECSEGLLYHGKIADIWALGVTLYCMVTGSFPFKGSTLRDTFDKIVKSPLEIPSGVNCDLVDLLKRLLCKDPNKRISLEEVLSHPWMKKQY